MPPIDPGSNLQREVDNNHGATVRLGAGTFTVDQPIILPRTGPYPDSAVKIIGDGPESTRIQGSADFPPGRGIFEWATPTTDSISNRMVGQKIANLTIALPFGVDKVRAVKHTPFNALGSTVACMNEWMQIDVSDVTVECTNAFNDVLFDFPNGFRFSRFHRVTSDPWLGVPSAPVKYDTLLIQVGSSYPNGPTFPGEDSIGVGFSHLSMLNRHQNRGGWCQTFSGRAYSTTFEQCIDNGGRYGTGAVAFHFINSSQLTLFNLACEGQGSCFLKFENCDSVDAWQMTGGVPPQGQGPYQDSIILINCRDVRIHSHLGVPGANPFSSLGIHAATMDAACRDCVFDGFNVRAMFDSPMPAPAAREFSIDPAAVGCRVGGIAVQAWQNMRQSFTVGN